MDDSTDLAGLSEPQLRELIKHHEAMIEHHKAAMEAALVAWDHAWDDQTAD